MPKWLLLLIACTGLVVHPGSAYDAAVDYTGDGRIDEADLHRHIAMHLETPAVSASYVDLFRLSRSWHSERGGASRPAVHLPQGLELYGTFGSYMGTFPVTIENGGGIAHLELVFTYPTTIPPTNSLFLMSLQGNRTTDLTAGFELSVEATAVPPPGGGSFLTAFKVTLDSKTPLPDGAAGPIANLSYIAVAGGVLTEPVPVLLDVYPDGCLLQDSGGNSVEGDFVSGSLILQPAGAVTPTGTPGGPTATPGGPTPTSTPTATDSPGGPTPTSRPGAGVALRIVMCETTGYAGSILSGFIDIVDEQGNIANHEYAGANPSSEQFTIAVDGNADFGAAGFNSTIARIGHANGYGLTIRNSVPEQVQLTVTTQTLAAPAPVTLTFLQTGRIAGQIRVPQPGGGVGPAASGQVRVFLLVEDERTYLFQRIVVNGNDGLYEFPSVPAGTYDLRFDAAYPSADACRRDITVAAGQTTEVDVDLSRVTNPGTLTGTLSFPDQPPALVSVITVSAVLQTTSGCDAQVYNAYVSPSLAYNFGGMAPGTYLVTASGSGSDDPPVNYTFYTSLAEEVTVPSGMPGVTRDIVLVPHIPVTPVSPVNYALETAPVTLVWSVPDGAPSLTYDVSIYDRCSRSVWFRQDVTGTEVTATGAVYDPEQIFHWNLTGAAAGGAPIGLLDQSGTLNTSFYITH